MSCAVMFGCTRRAAKKHPRTAPDTAINGRLGAKISSAVSARTSCSRYRAHGPANTLWASMAAVPKPSAVMLGHAAAAGQALRRQPRRRHIDARRGERDKHHVQRQNQLVKTHALAAQIRRQHDPEPHAQRPQHQPRPGEQRRIV